MSKYRKLYSGQTKSVIETKSLRAIKAQTGNIYKSIAVLSKRANQINVSTKTELHNILSDFESQSDNLEEIHENKEQIEISKAYEKLPNPALLATYELMNDKIYYRENIENDLFN